MTATVSHLKPGRKSPVRHYAFLGEVPGIATFTPGGYRFQADDASVSGLFTYNHPALTLLGRIDLAEEQRRNDEQAGGLAAIVCNPEWRLSRER